MVPCVRIPFGYVTVLISCRPVEPFGTCSPSRRAQDANRQMADGTGAPDWVCTGSNENPQCRSTWPATIRFCKVCGAPGPSAVASVHWGAAKAVLSSTRTVVTPVVTPRQQPAGNTALEMAEITPSLPSTYVGTYTSPPARKDQPSPRQTPFITSVPAPASSSETSNPAPAAVSAVSASPEQSGAGARPAAGALYHIGRAGSHAVGR
jgi:hypothetical protein